MVVLYRARHLGRARLPRTGAVLLVANHQSYIDPPLVGITVRSRHLDFIARMGLFNSPILDRILRAVNSVPIREEGGDAAAIKEILRRLDQGRAVLIFPEGTRSPDGAMRPFKRGVAVLVKRAKCPVVPVAVEGCFDAWPRERKWPRLLGQHVAVAFDHPISHAELMAAGPDAALELLEARIERMRVALRRWMRRTSHGRYPPAGAGDSVMDAADSGRRAASQSAGESRTVA
jgi:1-acyl-sn-glycerol-3-phosphate acyltransferase